MKIRKKTLLLFILSALILHSPPPAEANTYCMDTGGYAYVDSYQACCLAPAITLGVVAIVALIIFGITNGSSSSHSH